MGNKASSGGRWVTIRGVHAFIGSNGKITKGPQNLLGDTLDEASKKLSDDKKVPTVYKQLKTKPVKKLATKSSSKSTIKKEKEVPTVHKTLKTRPVKKVATKSTSTTTKKQVPTVHKQLKTGTVKKVASKKNIVHKTLTSIPTIYKKLKTKNK